MHIYSYFATTFLELCLSFLFQILSLVPFIFYSWTSFSHFSPPDSLPPSFPIISQSCPFCPAICYPVLSAPSHSTVLPHSPPGNESSWEWPRPPAVVWNLHTVQGQLAGGEGGPGVYPWTKGEGLYWLLQRCLPKEAPLPTTNRDTPET